MQPQTQQRSELSILIMRIASQHSIRELFAFCQRGIEALLDEVYRVLSIDNALVSHIQVTGRLPLRFKPTEPVLRSKPRGHWCAYEKWPTPSATRHALQILPEWGDCKVRATIRTKAIANLAFLPYSLKHGVFEGITQDYDDPPDQLEGNAVQICVYGEPEVAVLEEWNELEQQWRQTLP